MPLYSFSPTLWSWGYFFIKPTNKNSPESCLKGPVVVTLCKNTNEVTFLKCTCHAASYQASSHYASEQSRLGTGSDCAWCPLLHTAVKRLNMTQAKSQAAWQVTSSNPPRTTGNVAVCHCLLEPLTERFSAFLLQNLTVLSQAVNQNKNWTNRDSCVLTLMVLICLKISLIFGFVLPAAFVTHPLVGD